MTENATTPIPARHTVTTIPAQPSWEMGYSVEAREHEHTDRAAHIEWAPIIAWDIERSEVLAIEGVTIDLKHRDLIHVVVTPITANPGWLIDRMSQLWVIKRPDGKFEVRGENTFESEAEVIDFLGKQNRMSYEPPP
jgi:hypothetical protein